MSNLTELLPAGGGGKNVNFVASGTLASGQTVALKTNGQVEAVSGVTQAVGSPVVFESASTPETGSAYDANAQRVVIAYRDSGNSDYGTAVVGTVSGTSISFGTPVVFETAVTRYSAVTYDANAQKIVIAYRDSGNSNLSTAIVGTVSGTSISFGTAVVFDSSSGASNKFAATYDVNAQKVVIAYMDSGDNGFAIVGTVSGTSISFGSRATIESSRNDDLAIVYDSSAQKIVIAYKDIQNSSYGTGAVGTVSGTSISFGTPSVFNTGTTNQNSIAYDANAQKVVVVFQDHESSNHGAAIVGTVSGTSISFGSKVTFNAAATTHPEVAYDANAKKVVISYNDNNSLGEVIAGTVSGTSISFSSAVQFEPAAPQHITTVYDSTAQKVVTSYQDSGNSSYGTSFVFQAEATNNTSFLGITDAAISNSASGSVTIKGGINKTVTGLTPNATYYVQADGTLNTATSVVNYDIASASYTQAFSVASQDTLPSAIAFNPAGTKMFIAGNQGNDIGEYTLSTAFDVSTASFVDSFSVNSQETAPMGVAFNTDGTRMFVNGEAANTVFQYALSTGFDVSTASYTQGFSTAAQDSASNGIAFNTDGTKMFVTAESTKKINEYTLSSAFDVSTASYVDGFSVVSQADQPKDTQFNSDGTEMYVVSRSPSEAVYKYTLTTGFDVSTASYANVSFSIANQETSPQGLAFSANGSKMYVCGFTGQDVNEYATSATVTNSSAVLAGKALSSTSINLDYTT